MKQQPLDLRMYSVRTDLAIEAHEIAVEERLQQKRKAPPRLRGSSSATKRSMASSCRTRTSQNKERHRSAKSRAIM